MANSAKTSNPVVGTTIDALVAEGKALGKIWKQTNSLKDSTKANGFDTRLGKLLQQLKAMSSLDSGQVSRQVLVAHGIDTIDRRRRAEALWFVENEVACREFMKSSKKGFTSLSALQKAMSAASKPTAKAETSDVGQSDATSAKAEPKSSATEHRSVSVQITRSKMVDTILHHCKENNLNIEDIINDLQSYVAKQQRKSAQQLRHLCSPFGDYIGGLTFILKGYIMNTVKIIFDKYGFWHVYRTDRITGQRTISFFQNVDEAKASLLK